MLFMFVWVLRLESTVGGFGAFMQEPNFEVELTWCHGVRWPGWYCVAWYGHGTVWLGMAWSWYSVAWHGHGTVWHGQLGIVGRSGCQNCTKAIRPHSHADLTTILSPTHCTENTNPDQIKYSISGAIWTCAVGIQSGSYKNRPALAVYQCVYLCTWKMCTVSRWWWVHWALWWKWLTSA